MDAPILEGSCSAESLLWMPPCVYGASITLWVQHTKGNNNAKTREAVCNPVEQVTNHTASIHGERFALLNVLDILMSSIYMGICGVHSLVQYFYHVGISCPSSPIWPFIGIIGCCLLLKLTILALHWDSLCGFALLPSVLNCGHHFGPSLGFLVFLLLLF